MEIFRSIDFQFYSPLLVTDDHNAVLRDASAFFLYERIQTFGPSFQKLVFTKG